MTIKIAFEIESDGKPLCTVYAKPSKLMSQLQIIQEQKSWSVKETYLVNGYGMRLEVNE